MTNGRAPPSTKAKIVQFTRGAAVLAAAALVTGGLTACGEDEPVDPSSSSTLSPLPGNSTAGSSSSSSTSSSSAASSDSSGSDGDLPEDFPDAAKEETKEGAAAFGEYYYATLGDASHTGDTSALEKLGTKDCGVCKTAIENIEEEHNKGWSRSKNPYSMSNVEATKRPDTGYKVSMKVDVAAHKRLDADGKANGIIDATHYTLTEHLVWQDGAWRVKDWIAT